MEEYLAAIKADTVRELEQELLSVERLETLQNRLYVLRSINEAVIRDISNGRVAEKTLREAEVDE